VYAVEVIELAKRYKNQPVSAVDGVSFTVEPGEILGLLGPNGAGKTTTVGVLTTRILPTAGRAVVGGVDVVTHPARARQLLGVVPQHNNLDRSLSIRDNLLFHAAYHGVEPARRTALAESLLARMGLAGRASARVDATSGGQAQRVMIARALMHRPRVLFLDEPSTGLDPQARLFMHDRILELKADGVAVVLTTHDMDEAAKLSDRVAIIDHGRLLLVDTPAGLTRRLPGGTTISLTTGAGAGHAETMRVLSDVDGVDRVDADEADPGALRLRTTREPAPVLAAALRAVGDLGVTVSDLSIGTLSLEDAFIHLTGRQLR
jgi:ABC-2 type transport system ATP-binding protein